MMKKWVLIVVLSLLTGVGIGIVMWKYVPFKTKREILSPLGLTADKNRMEVIGFLPTWMIGKTKLYGEELTQLIFSGIEVNKDGSLVWDVQSKKINNDNFLAVKKSVKDNGGKNIISIELFTDKNLDALVASDSARQTLYKEVGDIVQTGQFDGVNVDFEYMSDAQRILNDDMVIMFQEMKNAGWGEVSVDVFANTIIKGDPEKLKRLATVVDKVIVMAYDFHRPGSDMAGAVAPINANDPQKSIEAIFGKIIQVDLDRSKLIMAYPLYGYEWETDSDALNSKTRDEGYGRTVMYKDPPTSGNYGEAKWDELTQSPWVAWTEKRTISNFKFQKVGKKTKRITVYSEVDQWHQAYFEDEKSLQLKINLAKKNEVGGVGFWALGYEGKESNLISKFQKTISK